MWTGSPGGRLGLLEVDWVSWMWTGSPEGRLGSSRSGVGSTLSVLSAWPGLMCTSLM